MDDYEDYPTPEEIEAIYAESWSPAMLAEVTAATTPSHTALFRRDRETLWLNAYPSERRIVETHLPITLPTGEVTPGLIREIGVGARVNIVDAFYALADDAVRNGWERRPCIYVDAGDPWSTPSVLDDGREMPF